MQVLLINPKNEDLYNPAYWPPLGLLYLAAALQAGGHDVRVIDMALDPIPDTRLSAGTDRRQLHHAELCGRPGHREYVSFSMARRTCCSRRAARLDSPK